MSDGPLGHVTIVLVRPRQPGNVGTAARAIANHGLGGLALVDPPGFDPERARWMAPGAGEIIDRSRIVGTVREAVAGAGLVVGTTGRMRRWAWPVVGPGALAERVLANPEPVAVLFGPEDTGLSNQDMELCQLVLCLPTATHASLNLGQAVTVLASTLLQAAPEGAEAPGARQRPRRGEAGELPAADPPAPVEQRAAAIDAAVELLALADYLDSRSAEQVRGTLYRLLSRAEPTDRELSALRGMVKSLDYRLRRA